MIIGLPGKLILGDYFQENMTSYGESVFREDLFLYNSSLAEWAGRVERPPVRVRLGLLARRRRLQKPN